MPSFIIKVPNNDEGQELGEYEADYLPRVGDPFVLWHPMLGSKTDDPFCGIVSAVTHEAFHGSHPYAKSNKPNVVVTTVWIVEEHAAPTFYCDCTEEQRTKWKVDSDGRCESCGHVRRT